MKLFLKTAITSLVLILTASQTKAVLFTDLDTINQKLTAGGPVSTYTSTFNIVDDGFIAGTHNVWAAGVTFWLADDGGFGDGGESFTINLFGDNNTFGTSQYTTFLVLGVTQIGIDLLASLNNDGILTYSISATSGDFWLKSALLAAEATVTRPLEDSQSVPDNGSTLILAAFALIGLTFMQWRVAKRC